MAQITGLLEAIINDDKTAYDALGPCGNYRLGRFPVLSLLYMYGAKRILSAHEKSLLEITAWQAEDEPAAVSKEFSRVAGKCLRLYSDEVVTPLEMLLILDKTRKFKRIYPAVKPQKDVCERLKSIYSIKYSLNIKFEGDTVILDRRPMTRREKKTVAVGMICSALAAVIAVGVPVTTVALIPKPVEGEVKKLSQIDFASKKEYTLKSDITLPENFSASKFNCRIYGDGNKIIAGKGASLGELNGKLSGVTVQSSGALFTSVSENATIENATFNVTADITSGAATALVAVTNFGTIDGVEVNVGGTIRAQATTDTPTDELIFGGVVLVNNYKYSSRGAGTVKNCTVNYSQLLLVGEASANAVFGGIAGVNAGYVQDCTVTGSVSADTFDLAGVCVNNSGRLSDNVNEAALTQTSSDAGWNPMSCGIVMNNDGLVTRCENRADISAASTSTAETETPRAVAAAGVSYLNGGEISLCKNSGSLFASGDGTVYAGGISAVSHGLTVNCISGGEITAAAADAYVGGIVGSSVIVRDIFAFYYGVVQDCISENAISVTAVGDKPSCVGGIIGLVQQGNYDGTYFGGGVTGSCFTGTNNFTGNYSGAIVGVVGKNIYDNNSYTSGETEYHNFEGNYFLSGTAFGAAVENEEFSAVADKGADIAAPEEIINSDAYKEILAEFEK